MSAWTDLNLTSGLRPLAPAIYIGWQETGDGGGFALYNLTEDIEGHPTGSTVSARTLLDLGYRMPMTPGSEAEI